jgi:hypothetical protein
MADANHTASDRTVNPEVRYEPSDARFKPIFLILVAALVLGVLIHLALWWFFHDYRNYQARIKKSPFPLAPGPSTALPRGPRLEQINRLAEIETGDVYERLAVKEEVLRTYGQTSEKGFVRIPIEQAMKHLENKLPARAQPSPEQQRRSGGLVTGGESNSGRLFRKPNAQARERRGGAR